MDNFKDFYNSMQSSMDRLKECESIRTFRIELMNCKTHNEINSLMHIYNDLINDNPGLHRAVKYARKRVSVIDREKVKSFNSIMN